MRSRTPVHTTTNTSKLPACCTWAVAASLLGLLFAGPAFAQFRQYTAPGSLGLTPVATKDALEEAMSEAPWDVGPVRLAPWFSLRDITYYDSVTGAADEAEGDDLSASIGAGLQGYLPVGRRLIVAGYAMPEYVWWRDRSERRLWNGRYGAGVFGYFSRVTLEARSGWSREQQIANAELEQPINLRTNTDQAKLEVRVFERLALFAEAESNRIRYRDEDLDPGVVGRLSRLDRDETHIGGGVRYRPREHFTIGAGIDRVDSEFVDPIDDRSSSGTGPFVEVAAEGRRLAVQGRVAWVSLEPDGASTFAPYDAATGNVTLNWKPGANVSWQVYGGRSLAFAYRADSPYYVDSRVGAAVVGNVGWRGTYRLFYETGTNSYRATGDSSGVEDDLEAYGAAFNIELGENTSLVLGAERTAYTSTVAARDRDVNRILASLRFTSATARWW